MKKLTTQTERCLYKTTDYNSITVTDDNKLIAGERRLTAHVISVKDDGEIYTLEFAENDQRKEFTLTEKFYAVKALTPAVGVNKCLTPKGVTQNNRQNDLAKLIVLSSKQEVNKLSRIIKKDHNETP